MSVSQIVSFVSEDFTMALLPHVVGILIYVSPLFLAITLFIIAWDLWVDYVQNKQFLGLKYVVLELKLPKDTWKSPLAMETVLHALHNTADGSKYAQYWKGETRPWYSLELISIEGQVKFLIWTEDRRKAGLMGALYSQFPTIEIIEREDYTCGVNFDPNTIRIWAAEFILTKDDPYPIKTYVDYGLEKDPKEEYKVDPLTHYIEFLGSIKPNQQNWIQIMIRAHNDDQKKPGTLFGKYDSVKDNAEKLVNDLMIREKGTKASKTTIDDDGKMLLNIPRLSKIEQETISAIERKVSKLMFDVGIRVLYISQKDSFDTPFGVGGNISSWKQFNSEAWNGFKGNGKKWHYGMNGVPWEDYKNMRRNRFGRLALMAYKRRSFFYAPFQSKPVVLNTEELATIYHFPGSIVAATPGLERVPSKKATAPGNLPI